MVLVLLLILSCQLLFTAGTELKRWNNDSGLVSVNNGKFQLNGRWAKCTWLWHMSPELNNIVALTCSTAPTPTGSICFLTLTWIPRFTTLQPQASLSFEPGHSTTWARNPPRELTSRHASMGVTMGITSWPRWSIDIEEWKRNDKYRCRWLTALGQACCHSKEIRHQAYPDTNE